MGNTDGYACLLCQAQDEATEVMDMAMDNVIRATLAQNPFEVASVQPRLLWMKARNNLAAEGADFVIVRARLCRLNQEVHMEAIAVKVSQDVHQPSFNASPTHAFDDMEDAN
jgi:hypothetical protein